MREWVREWEVVVGGWVPCVERDREWVCEWEWEWEEEEWMLGGLGFVTLSSGFGTSR